MIMIHQFIFLFSLMPLIYIYFLHHLSQAWKYWTNGTASNLIDPAMNLSSKTEIMKFIHIGLLCVQENVADRPTMDSVVHMLNSQYHDSLATVPSKPGFFMGSSYTNIVAQQAHSDQSFSTTQGSVDEAPITQLFPR